MTEPTVKDLIEWLSRLPPNTEVHLDRDVWEYCHDVQNTITDTGVFHIFTSSIDGEITLFINN